LFFVEETWVASINDQASLIRKAQRFKFLLF
jgi:hypothetical protein